MTYFLQNWRTDETVKIKCDHCIIYERYHFEFYTGNEENKVVIAVYNSNNWDIRSINND